MMAFLLPQIVFVPALVSPIIFLFRHRLGKRVAWIAALSLVYSTVLLAVTLASIYPNGSVYFEILVIVQPEVKLALLADGLSLSVALVSNILCLILGLFSIKYVAYRIEAIYEGIDERRQVSYYALFFSLFLFFPVGFMGVSLSADLVAVYFFLEILTISLYFLMANYGYVERVRIAMMSLVWGIFSALAFLAGILIIYSEIGTFEIAAIGELSGSPMAFWAIAAILLGMFAKLALVPLHVWMPWVHAEHPTNIAGLLAVYANIAAYVVVRVLVLPLWDDFAWFGPVIMVIAVVTMLYGALLTLAQTDVKRIAACSTISQIAYSMLGVGALTVSSIQGGIFFFLSHIIGKTVFFSTAGILVYTTHIRDIRQLGGLASRMPITALLFLAGGMMLSGIPPFATLPAKVIMFTGIFQRGDALGLWTGIIGLVATLLTMGYAFTFARRIFFGPLPESLNNDHVTDPPLLMSVPLIFLLVLSAALGLYPRMLIDLLQPVLGVVGVR